MIFIVEVKNRLMQSPLIKEKIDNRMYAYEAGETADLSDLFVIISPLGPPDPEKGVSDNYMAESHMVQASVEGKNLNDVKIVQNEIRRVMHSFGLRQLSDGLDEYFNATKHYVDSRNYEGIPNGFYYKKKLI